MSKGMTYKNQNGNYDLIILESGCCKDCPFIGKDDCEKIQCTKHIVMLGHKSTTPRTWKHRGFKVKYKELRERRRKENEQSAKDWLWDRFFR